MGKIQQALQKLNQDTSRRPSRRVGGLDDATTVADNIESPAMRSQAGKTISLTDKELQMAGVLPPESVVDMVAEQFRAVKRPLIDNAMRVEDDGDVAPNVLMVTSAQQGEGKTFCTFNLASSIAREKDLPVTVIDGDVLSPKLSYALGVEDSPGLMDYLHEQNVNLNDLTYRLEGHSVTFLPAGPPNTHAHELLASKKMERLIRDISSNTPGIVILDSPPILGANEARVLARHVGQILLVVAAGITPQTTIIEAVNLLDTDRPLNVLLNKKAGRPARYTTYGSYGRK